MVSARRRRRERGAAALELALVMPVLLLLIIGIAALGHAMMVRFMLNGAAYDAARMCSLEPMPSTTCTNKVVKDKLGGTAQWCTSLRTWATVQKENWLTEVSSLEVRVECVYGGIIGNKSYNQAHGINLGTLRARATMPY